MFWALPKNFNHLIDNGSISTIDPMIEKGYVIAQKKMVVNIGNWKILIAKLSYQKFGDHIPLLVKFQLFDGFGRNKFVVTESCFNCYKIVVIESCFGRHKV
jgi:hypothetical protein